MPKFRRKITEIEAEQFTGNATIKGVCRCKLTGDGPAAPHLHTIHKGQHVFLRIGDWVIPEPDGEHFYPCKPDIFEATYELITEQDVHRLTGEQIRKLTEFINEQY